LNGGIEADDMPANRAEAARTTEMATIRCFNILNVRLASLSLSLPLVIQQVRRSVASSKFVLSGLTDGDPYAVEPIVAPKFASLKQRSPQLLHIELVNRLENVRQTVALPALGGGVEYAAEILEPLGEASRKKKLGPRDRGRTN